MYSISTVSCCHLRKVEHKRHVTSGDFTEVVFILCISTNLMAAIFRLLKIKLTLVPCTSQLILTTENRFNKTLK